jgi:hypothetical protein
MVNRIELPQMPQGDAEKQMKAMYSYLYQMAQALNNNLAEIGGAELTDSERIVMREVLAADAEEQQTGVAAEAETLKSLIIKTASFIKTAIDQYDLKLMGSTLASGKMGRVVRNTQLDVDVTPEGIQQSYTFQEIIQGLKRYEINAKNYIKSGLLRTEGGLPVYGVAIGKDIVTFAEDGTETYNDGNKVAELTAEELSFWQNGAKVAGYKGSGISFAQNVTIASGKKLIIDTENFKINSAGNVTIKGGGEFSGELKAASGTFAGTMSAACITSGTMSANRISGGTLTLGGNNNANGTLIIKDASGAQIGKWDKDGISATKGSFSGNLNAAGGTFAGTMSAAGITSGTMSADRISGGTIDATDVSIINLNASNITGGTMSANRISGGSIDASNVTITNLSASNITGGTMSASMISGGSIDASNVTITNLSASNITGGTMSANRISGGTIDATDVMINNLDASKITSGTMSASRITSGTMSANRISGGTLTLGGNNNTNGTILIYDASGAQIGKWDNNGLSATKGSFSGTLNSAGGTFSGSLSCIGQQILVSTTNLDINGEGTLKTISQRKGVFFEAQIGGISSSVEPQNGHTKATIQQSTNITNSVEYPDVLFTYVNRSTSTRYRHDTSLRLGTTNRQMYDGTLSVGPYMQLSGNTIDQVSSTNSASLLLDGTNVDAFFTKLRATDARIQNLNYTNMAQQSSRDVKHDIQDMPSMGERLDALHPITFVYDDDEEERTRYGLIYEDAVEVLPEICTGREENKAISYVELITMLLKEIQELRGRVSELERRLENVQGD